MQWLNETKTISRFVFTVSAGIARIFTIIVIIRLVSTEMTLCGASHGKSWKVPAGRIFSNGIRVD